MNTNLLAIDAGNTRTHVGVFLDGKLAQSAAVENNDLKGLGDQIEKACATLDSKTDKCAMLASVDAQRDQQLASLAAGRIDGPFYRAEKDLSVPIGRQLDPETIVGVDRLLNAAAAYDVLRQACIVVDAGTAMTVDLIDGAGTFHGGAIAPGAQMMLTSLHKSTAQLPDLRFAPPQEPVGHSTAQAMLTAVFHGMRGMVRELIEQYAQVIGTFPVVVATGGDAPTLFKDFDMVDRIVPDLTLIGMALTLQSATKTQL